MLNNSIESLYDKVNLLLRHCEELQQSNNQLVQREQQWQQERAQLIEKNELARTRIEAMISHLKKLQHNAGSL